MTTKVFSISEALRFGWNTTKSNLGFFIGLLIVFWLLLIVPFIIASEVSEINIFLGFILQIADYVLTMLISMGLVKIVLSFCDNEKGKLSDLFSQYRLFFKYLATSILYFLIVFGGIILFIIPGIIWSIKFWFFDYFVIDKGLRPMEALKKSSAITQGVKWKLFTFFIVISLININLLILSATGFAISLDLFVFAPSTMLTAVIVLVASLLLISSFITVPTTMLARAFVYRKLLAQTEIVTTSQIVPQVASQVAPEAIA